MDIRSKEEIIKDKVLEATKIIEQHLDDNIAYLDELKNEDIDEIRKRRIIQMKEQWKLKEQLKKNGHGEYNELKEEKELFTIFKKSSKVIVHFYRNDAPRCKILDKHLEILATKHLETRFCKLLADNAMFFVERLRIKFIPTVALIKDGMVIDYIVGFTELGNRDDFKTDILEWTLAVKGLINYDGDLTRPPSSSMATTPFKDKKNQKTIRSGNNASDDDGQEE